MATPEAMVCPRCGAPLPLDLVASPRCRYCGVPIRMAGGSIDADEGGRVVDREAFWSVLVEAIKAGKAPFGAIRDAAATHLGVMGQSDVVARVTVALATRFGRANGLSLMDDGMALARIAQAYVKAIPSLRESGQATLNLPFLAATDKGPVHFDETLTPAKVAALLAGDGGAAPVAAAHPPGRAPREPEEEVADAPVPAPPKKRGWWPFR